MRIAQDYHYQGKDWWDWSVWIEGTAAELNRIEQVTWQLHPSFSPSKVTKQNRADAFKLSTSGWGTFTIRADVKLTVGKSRKLQRELELYYENAGESSPAPSKEEMAAGFDAVEKSMAKVSPVPVSVPTVVDRINAPGPKKILSCDGGGILSLVSVEILSKIESDLRARTGRPDLVLADWFDFVCGSGTGAVIATYISLGMSTAQIRDIYLESGPLMFEQSLVVKRLTYAPADEPLARLLRQEINRAAGRSETDAPVTLGDDRLRTVLMMVMRNHATDSAWPVTNNPYARYNDRNSPGCNLDLPLWNLVRASTSASTLFPPEVVVFGSKTPREFSFAFTDGGVTTYNNPAFLAFQMATARPYGINWKTGTDQLLVVSVGTGAMSEVRRPPRGELSPLDRAKIIPSALVNAASVGWDMACRTIGECRFGDRIDREFGDGMEPKQSTVPKQFTYVRYDPDTTAEGLNGLGLSNVDPEHVQVMDSVAHVADIQHVGQAFASSNVTWNHFRDFV